MKKIKIITIIFGFLAITMNSINLYSLTKQNIPISNYLSFNSVSAIDQTNDINYDLEKEALKHIPKPTHVKGIYMSSWVAGTPSVRNRLTNLINETEINSVVIDFKDSTGVVSIPATDGANKDRINAQSKRALDLEEYIKELHINNVYVIARIAVFEDPIYAKNNHNVAVQNSNGDLWVDRHGLAWVDASDTNFHKYILDLSYEAYELGFDEINLDYIRFPTDGSKDKVFPISGNGVKQDIIKNFTVYIHENLKSKNIPLSIDVFGQILTDPNDVNIGQYYEYLLPHVETISPMIYPSHFYPGYKGMKSPEANPYETIRLSLQDGINRQKLIGNTTEIRPWFQDFSMEVSYGANEVKAQIAAAHDLGIDSFLLWDPKNHYTKEALLLESKN